MCFQAFQDQPWLEIGDVNHNNEKTVYPWFVLANRHTTHGLLELFIVHHSSIWDDPPTLTSWPAGHRIIVKKLGSSSHPHKTPMAPWFHQFMVFIHFFLNHGSSCFLHTGFSYGVSWFWTWCSHWPSSMAQYSFPMGNDLWKRASQWPFYGKPKLSCPMASHLGPFQIQESPLMFSEKTPRPVDVGGWVWWWRNAMCRAVKSWLWPHREVSTIATRGWWVLLGKSIEIPGKLGDLSGIQLEYHWDKWNTTDLSGISLENHWKSPKKAMTCNRLRTFGNAGPFSFHDLPMKNRDFPEETVIYQRVERKSIPDRAYFTLVKPWWLTIMQPD